MGITSSGLTLTVDFPSSLLVVLLSFWGRSGYLTFQAINIQLVFNTRNPGQTARPVRRFPLPDLFVQVVSGRSTRIKSLYAQPTGVAGEQPLLGIVFASQADVWPYSMYVGGVHSLPINSNSNFD